MIDALPLLLSDEGYQISRSVRLRSSASGYFDRTPSSAGNRRTWTWSGWIKRGNLDTFNTFWSAFSNGSNFDIFQFNSNQALELYVITGGVDYSQETVAVFRDASAWYHVVLSVDTTQATASNRIRIYVNGVQQSTTQSYGQIPQNYDTFTNSTNPHNLGRNLDTTTRRLDGYLTEVNFIDGQALTPSSFGETNTVTGVWQPKKYAGTYGTNGFYLNFSDNSAATAAAIGKDYSGNGNNWTPNNISLTAGVTYDSMLDVPTQWADGGNGRGNYCTFNPNSFYAGGGTGTISDGNLKAAFTNQRGIHGSLAVSSGKWYWEVKLTSASINSTGAGIVTDSQSASNTSPYFGWVLDVQAGRNYYNNAFTTLTGGAFATGDTMGIAVDMDSGKIWYAKNGTWLGTSADPAAGTGAAQTNVSGTVTPIVFEGNSGFSATWEATFGQRPFAYTPPSGFKALNTLNLPTPTILKGNQYFDATTYTGTGASLNVVNSGGMQPDFVWTKPRSTAVGHTLFDSVRGVTKYLQSNTTGAEGTAATSLTAFNSDGFTVNSDTSTGANGVTYVGWQWKEGATQGFDIVTFTSDGSTLQTVTHNLGVSPDMIIVKPRSAVGSWGVYHKNLTSTNWYLNLNSTAAQTDGGVQMWGVSSSNFQLRSSSFIGANGTTAVAYLFAAVSGYSAFGSYTGNGSADGPFVFCGFRPRYVMIKNATGTASANTGWYIFDAARNTFNTVSNSLRADLSDAEVGGYAIDFVSNGFKLRISDVGINSAAGATHIFAAFCENPFKNALAR